MLFRNNGEHEKYIFFVPLCHYKLKHTDLRKKFDDTELKDAIVNGVDSHKAIFAFALISEKYRAKLLAESYLRTKTSNNYWIVAVNMSFREYDQYRKKFFGANLNIGSFLHPLRDKIIYCENGDGERLSIKLEQVAYCTVL